MKKVVYIRDVTPSEKFAGERDDVRSTKNQTKCGFLVDDPDAGWLNPLASVYLWHLFVKVEAFQ